MKTAQREAGNSDDDIAIAVIDKSNFEERHEWADFNEITYNCKMFLGIIMRIKTAK